MSDEKNQDNSNQLDNKLDDFVAVSHSRLKSVHAGKARNAISVLLVCENRLTSSQLRQAVKTLGFGQISSVSSHIQALDRLRGRNFDLVIFDAKSKSMPCDEFVGATINLDSHCMMIAMSAEPRVDDVFGLLRSGAKGFIALPFTVESVEEIVSRAKDGPPLSEAVLCAPDRNSALVGVILNSLYRVSVLMRQAREFESAARELERQKFSLVETVDLARLFCQGGDEALLETIVEGCLQRANNASSRLGRTRKRLKKTRGKSETEESASGTGD